MLSLKNDSKICSAYCVMQMLSTTASVDCAHILSAFLNSDLASSQLLPGKYSFLPAFRRHSVQLKTPDRICCSSHMFVLCFPNAEGLKILGVYY